MRRRATLRSIVLALAVAAAVAVASPPASATYVAGLGFTVSAEVTCTPISGSNFGPWHPVMGDLNGDGIPDIVCGGAVGSAAGLNIFLGREDGRYSVPTTVAIYDSIPNVEIGDIDGDDVPDLVANMNGQYAWTLIGNGDGTFSQPTTITNSYGARDAHLVDCDNDGIKDLVSGGSVITLRKGNGAGGFGAALVSTETVTMGNTGYELDVADVNGDGLKDVAVTDGSNGEVRFFRGTGNAFAVAATASVDSTKTSYPLDVAFVQLDADPRPEVVVVNKNSLNTGRVTAYDGSGPGFGYARVWDQSLTYGGEQVEIGDVDQDGWDDVLVHETWTDVVHVFDNDGSGTLDLRYSWTGRSTFYGFGLADADGDGRLDIVEAFGNFPGKVAVAHNDLPAKVTRIFGPNRYATGAAASASAVKTSEAVVIATGANFPDALSAAGLCGALRAPLLLVSGNSVPTSVSAEIERLGATKAWIVGGTSSVSTDMANALAAAPLSLEVTRVAGGDRYETSRKVAAEIARLSGPIAEVFIARGDNFPDALAAAPLSYWAKWPILLTKPTVLSPATAAALDDLDPLHADVLGKDTAVSSDVFDAIADRGIATTRVAGDDRYKTAVAIAKFGVGRGVVTWRDPYIATGANFPDALAGGAAAGSLRGLLLLTPTGYLHSAASAALVQNHELVREVRVLGGTSAVSDTALGEARDAVR